MMDNQPLPQNRRRAVTGPDRLLPDGRRRRFGPVQIQIGLG